MNKSIFEQKVEWIIKTPFYNNNITDALVKAVSEELLELAKIELNHKALDDYLAPKIKSATESWKGIDVDKFMEDMRGEGIEVEKIPNTPDKPLTPKEEGEAYLHICNKAHKSGYKEGYQKGKQEAVIDWNRIVLRFIDRLRLE